MAKTEWDVDGNIKWASEQNKAVVGEKDNLVKDILSQPEDTPVDDIELVDQPAATAVPKKKSLIQFLFSLIFGLFRRKNVDVSIPDNVAQRNDKGSDSESILVGNQYTKVVYKVPGSMNRIECTLTDSDGKVKGSYTLTNYLSIRPNDMIVLRIK